MRRAGRAALVAVGAIAAFCPAIGAVSAGQWRGLRGNDVAFVAGSKFPSTRTGLGSCTFTKRSMRSCGKLSVGMTLMNEEQNKAPSMVDEALKKLTKATDYYKPLVEGDILESTNQQRAIVAGSFIVLAMLIVKGLWLLNLTDGSAIGFVIAALVGFEFADFGSGVYHWSMDNYGNKNTPIFGTQIEAFQGHHELPWTITYRQVCNNIYKICQASTPFALVGLLFIDNPYILAWMSTAISFINMSQELHKWSHMSPSQAPALVNALQDANIIIGRKAHLAHHKPPFDGNYCIVSGHCNNFLDDVGFFRWMEKIVYNINGAEARCWTNERLLQDTVESLGIKKSTKTLERSD